MTPGLSEFPSRGYLSWASVVCSIKHLWFAMYCHFKLIALLHVFFPLGNFDLFSWSFLHRWNVIVLEFSFLSKQKQNSFITVTTKKIFWCWFLSHFHDMGI